MKRSFVTALMLAISISPPAPGADPTVVVEMDPSWPVIVSGKDMGSLLGIPPDRIVGFSWRDGKWVRVPVQVDQKVLAPRGQAGGNPAIPLKERWKSHYIFADPKNAAGPGGAALGEHDEIAMLYDDFGSLADAAAADPAGVVPKSRVDLKATVQGRPSCWLYLFQSAGDLKPDAARKPVDYRFHSLIAPQDRKRWEEITPEISSYRFIPHRKVNKVQHELPPLPSEDSTVQGDNYRLDKGKGVIKGSIKGSVRSIDNSLTPLLSPMRSPSKKAISCYEAVSTFAPPSSIACIYKATLR